MKESIGARDGQSWVRILISMIKGGIKRSRYELVTRQRVCGLGRKRYGKQEGSNGTIILQKYKI